jgi:hypothetical protein
MGLADLADVAVIVQATILVASLIAVGLQLREGNRLARASGLHALTTQAAEFSGQIVADEDVARLWYSRGHDLASDLDRIRYREILIQWLLIQENVYYQSQDGLLPQPVVDGWTVALHKAVRRHNFRLIDPKFEQWFPGPFGDHIAGLIDQEAPQVGAPHRKPIPTGKPDGPSEGSADGAASS